MYLVLLQFLLCPRFPNRNALIPPEQCLLVYTVTLAPIWRLNLQVMPTWELARGLRVEGASQVFRLGGFSTVGLWQCLNPACLAHLIMIGLTCLALQSQVPTQVQLLNVRER